MIKEIFDSFKIESMDDLDDILEIAMNRITKKIPCKEFNSAIHAFNFVTTLLQKSNSREVTNILVELHKNSDPLDKDMLRLFWGTWYNNYGSLFYDGTITDEINIPCDYNKAKAYYELADYCGEIWATVNLGYIYSFGKLGEVDHKKALQYFLVAAAFQNENAIYKVGDYYLNGLGGLKKDEHRAFDLYITALNTASNNQRAIDGFENSLLGNILFRVAKCFLFGIGVKKDLVRGMERLYIAREQAKIQLERGDIYAKNF